MLENVDKLSEIEHRFDELGRVLSDPSTIANRREFARLAKERSELEEVVSCFKRWKETKEELEGVRQLLKDRDEEVKQLAREELGPLQQSLERLEEELRFLLLPKDPNDERNVLLEIRAGTGGEEASLFAADLFRMYSRYAERQGWRMEVMNSNPTGLGGFKEIIALVEGKGAYSRLKYEGGVHRVQRVPVTEASGRIHTSAVSVAVLPEAEDIEVDINDRDLRIDVFRSSGPGGQSVNTTDSAVRITHLPSGLVVSCQDEKSQHKNKGRAMKILRARLLEKMEQEQASEIAANRRSMVGSGDRSERIRTYNFPQNRLTDHRINFTSHALERMLDGDLDELLDALTSYYQAEALKATS